MAENFEKLTFDIDYQETGSTGILDDIIGRLGTFTTFIDSVNSGQLGTAFNTELQTALMSVKELSNAFNDMKSAISGGDEIKNYSDTIFSMASAAQSMLTSVRALSKVKLDKFGTDIGAIKTTSALTSAIGVDAARASASTMQSFAAARARNFSTQDVQRLIVGGGSFINQKLTGAGIGHDSARAANFLANNADFQQYVKTAIKRDVWGQGDMEALATAIVRGGGFARDNNMAALVRSQASTMLAGPYGHIPQPFVNSFKSITKGKNASTMSQFGSAGTTYAAPEIVNALAKAMTRKNANKFIIDAMLQSGNAIVENNGELRIDRDMTVGDLSHLASMAMRQSHKALKGDKRYEIDFDNPGDWDRLTNKSSRGVSATDEFLSILAMPVTKQGEKTRVSKTHQGARLYGGLVYKTDTGELSLVSDNGIAEYDNQYIATKQRNYKPITIGKGIGRTLARISGVGNIAQFTVPQLHVDEDGNIIENPEEWQNWVVPKGRNPKEHAEDKIVGASYSPLLGLLGYNKSMHNTFGFGYDKEDRIRTMGEHGETPTIMRVDTSTMYTHDANGGFVNGVNTTQAIANAKLVNEGFEHAGHRYKYAWRKNDALTFVESGAYDKIANRFGAAGLANPFEGFNAEGVVNPSELVDTIKQINNVALMATPGNPFSDFDSKWSRQTPVGGRYNGHTAVVDEIMMYQLLSGMGEKLNLNGVDMKQIIDGASFFMPDRLPMEGQMRGAMAKFSGQRWDWKNMITQAATRAGKTKGTRYIRPEYADDPFIELDADKKTLHYYAPTLAAREKIKAAAAADGFDTDISEQMEAWAKTASGKAFLRDETFRDEYMVDLMDKNIYQVLLGDSSIKNRDKFGVMTAEQYIKMFGKEAYDKLGNVGDKKDASTRRYMSSIKKGLELIKLTGAEQQRYYNTATAMIGGIHLSNSDEDFSIERSEIAEQLATSLNLPTEVYRKSYDKTLTRLAALSTTAGKMNAIKARGQYYENKLLADPNFINSEQADAIIAEERASLSRKLTRGSVLTENDAVQDRLAKVLPSSILTLFGFKTEDMVKEMRPLFNQDRVLVPQFDQFQKLIMSRMPAAASMNDVVEIDNNAMREAYRILRNNFTGGYSDLNSIYASPLQMDRFNTGDFDGDTIWTIAAEKLGNADEITNRQRILQRRVDKARARIAKNSGVDMDKTGGEAKASVVYGDNAKKGDLGELVMQAAYGQAGSIGALGLGSKILRDAFQLSDDDETKYYAIASAIDFYDKATSEMQKKGMVSQQLTKRALEVAKLGNVYQRGYSMIDEVIADTSELSKASKSTLFSANLPSIRSTTGATQLLMGAGEARLAQGHTISRMKDLEDYYKKAGYNPFSAEGKAARAYMDLFGDVSMGQKLVNQDDITLLDTLLTQWRAELALREDKGAEDYKNEVKRSERFAKRIEWLSGTGAPTEKNLEAIKDSDEFSLAAMKLSISEADWKDLETAWSYYNSDRWGQPQKGKKSKAQKLAEKYFADTASMTDEELTEYYKTHRAAEVGEQFKRLKDEIKLVDDIFDSVKTARATGTYESDVEAREAARKKDDAYYARTSAIRETKLPTKVLQQLDRQTKFGMGFTGLESAWFDKNAPIFTNGIGGIKVQDLTKGINSVTTAYVHQAADGAVESIGRLSFDFFNPDAQLRRELTDEYEDSVATLTGTLAHDAFYSIASLSMGGSKDRPTARKQVEQLLKNGMVHDSGEGKDGNQPMSFEKAYEKFGIRYDERTHKFAPIGSTITSEQQRAADAANARLSKMIGEGTQSGTIDFLLAAIKQRDESIVGAEGRYVMPGQSSTDFRHVRRFLENGNDSLEFPVLPDLITRSKDGTFNMYDYKSSDKGAIDSLYQMLSYVSAMTTEGKKNQNSIFGQFVKGDKTAFKTLRGFDMSTGMEYSLDISGKEGETLLDLMDKEITRATTTKAKTYTEAKKMLADNGLEGNDESNAVYNMIKKLAKERELTVQQQGEMLAGLGEGRVIAGANGTATVNGQQMSLENEMQRTAMQFAFSQFTATKEKSDDIRSRLFKVMSSRTGMRSTGTTLGYMLREARENQKVADASAEAADAYAAIISAGSGNSPAMQQFAEAAKANAGLVEQIENEIIEGLPQRMDSIEQNIIKSRYRKETPSIISNAGALFGASKSAQAEVQNIIDNYAKTLQGSVKQIAFKDEDGNEVETIMMKEDFERWKEDNKIAQGSSQNGHMLFGKVSQAAVNYAIAKGKQEEIDKLVQTELDKETHAYEGQMSFIENSPEVKGTVRSYKTLSSLMDMQRSLQVAANDIGVAMEKAPATDSEGIETIEHEFYGKALEQTNKARTAVSTKLDSIDDKTIAQMRNGLLADAKAEIISQKEFESIGQDLFEKLGITNEQRRDVFNSYQMSAEFKRIAKQYSLLSDATGLMEYDELAEKRIRALEGTRAFDNLESLYAAGKLSAEDYNEANAQIIAQNIRKESARQTSKFVKNEQSKLAASQFDKLTSEALDESAISRTAKGLPQLQQLSSPSDVVDRYIQAVVDGLNAVSKAANEIINDKNASKSDKSRAAAQLKEAQSKAEKLLGKENIDKVTNDAKANDFDNTLNELSKRYNNEYINGLNKAIDLRTQKIADMESLDKKVKEGTMSADEAAWQKHNKINYDAESRGYDDDVDMYNAMQARKTVGGSIFGGAVGFNQYTTTQLRDMFRQEDEMVRRNQFGSTPTTDKFARQNMLLRAKSNAMTGLADSMFSLFGSTVGSVTNEDIYNKYGRQKLNEEFAAAMQVFEGPEMVATFGKSLAETLRQQFINEYNANGNAIADVYTSRFRINEINAGLTSEAALNSYNRRFHGGTGNDDKLNRLAKANEIFQKHYEETLAGTRNKSITARERGAYWQELNRLNENREAEINSIIDTLTDEDVIGQERTRLETSIETSLNTRERNRRVYEAKQSQYAHLADEARKKSTTTGDHYDQLATMYSDIAALYSPERAQAEYDTSLRMQLEDQSSRFEYSQASIANNAQRMSQQYGFGRNAANMINRASRLGYGFMVVDGARLQAQSNVDALTDQLTLNSRQANSAQAAALSLGLTADQLSEYTNSATTDERRRTMLNGMNDKQQQAISTYASRLQQQQLTQQSLAAQQKLLQSNSGAAGLLKGLGLSAASIGTTFITQKIRQAIQLATQEMKSFSSEMSMIQGIGMFSDEDMGAIKQNVVANAKKYKTSISQVSSATAALYRQGLNEEQVNQRLGSVVQLSKVAGIDTNTSNEVITMLLHTGLYSSAESAADAIAALGDAAATTAAQLTKALKKTAVSASEYGVSGGELNAFLTAVLEDTQLSGNIIGTGTATILNRLNKVSSGDELITDENGNTTSTGTIATALRYVGVNLYEGEGQAAKMRNPFDILEDLASGWEYYSDFDKQRISTAIGGQGRNATTFLEMMGALGENVDRYRELRQVERESSGVLGEKYSIMTDNVATTIETIKTEWQSIWTSDAAINTLQALVDGFKSFVDVIGEAEHPLLALIAPMTILAGLSAMINGGKVGLVVGAGMVLGGGIAMAATATRNANREYKAEQLSNTPGTREYYMAQHEEHQQKYDDYNTLLDRIETTKLKYGDKNYADMTKDERVQSLNALYEVIDNFDSAEDAAAALSDFQNGVVSFAETMDRVAKEIKERQNKEFEESLTAAMNAYEIEGGYSESFSKYMSSGIKGMSYIVDADGNYHLVSDEIAELYNDTKNVDTINDVDLLPGSINVSQIKQRINSPYITDDEMKRLIAQSNFYDFLNNPEDHHDDEYGPFSAAYTIKGTETLDDYVNRMAVEAVGDISEPVYEDFITGPLNIPETFGPEFTTLSLDEWLAAQGLPSSTSSPSYPEEPTVPKAKFFPMLLPNYAEEDVKWAYDIVANSPYEKYGITDDTLPMYLNGFFENSSFVTETVAKMKDMQKQGIPLTPLMEEIINTTPVDIVKSIIDWGNDTSGLVRDKNGNIFTINDMPVNLSSPSNLVAKEFLKHYNVTPPAKDENGMYDFGSSQMELYTRRRQRLSSLFSPFINGNFTDEELSEILEFFNSGVEDYDKATSIINEYESTLAENAKIQAERDRLFEQTAIESAQYDKDIVAWRKAVNEINTLYAQRDAAIPIYYDEYLPGMDTIEKAKSEAIAAAEEERYSQNTAIALKNRSKYEAHMANLAAYTAAEENIRSEIESNMLDDYKFVTNNEGQVIGYYQKDTGRESIQGEDKTFYKIDQSDNALMKISFKSTDETLAEVEDMKKRFVALNHALNDEANSFTRDQVYTDYLLEQDVFSSLLSTMGARIGVTEEKMAKYVSGKINAGADKYFNEDGTAKAEEIVELFKELYYNEEETKASYAAETGTQNRIFDYMYTTKNGVTYYSDTKDFSGAVYREGEAEELTAEDIEEPIDKGEVRFAKTGIKSSPSLMDMEGILTPEEKGYKDTTDAILEAFKKSKIDGMPTSISKLSDLVGSDTPSLQPYLDSNKAAMKILEELIVQENGGKKTAYTVDDFIAAVMKDNGKESLIETEKSAATYATSQYLTSETARAIESNMPLTYSQMQAVAEYNGVSIDAYKTNAKGFNAEYLYGFRSGENQILAGINAETQNYRARLKPTSPRQPVALGENPYLIPEEIQKYIDMGYIYDPETGAFTGIDYSKFSSDNLLAASLELSRMQTAELKSPLGVAREELTDAQKAMIASEEFRNKYGAYSEAYSGGMSDEILGYLGDYYKIGRIGTGARAALLSAYLPNLINGSFDLETVEGRQDLLSYMQEQQNNNPEGFSLLDNIFKLSEIMPEIAAGTYKATEAMDDFLDYMTMQSLVEAFSDDMEDYADMLDLVSDNSKKAANAQKKLNQTFSDVGGTQYYRNNFLNGKKDDETIKGVSGALGMSEEMFKSLSPSEQMRQVQQSIISDESILNDSLTAALNGMKNDMQATIDANSITLDGVDIDISQGPVNFEDILSYVPENVRANLESILAELGAIGGSATLTSEQTDDGTWLFKVITSLTGAGGAKPSGGGGGGKSAAAKLIEKLKRLITASTHQINMIQAQETKYEQKHELGNWANMVRLENDAQLEYADQLRDNIEQLKVQMSQTKKDSDDWYDLRDAIFEAEEAIEKVNNTIDANNKKLEENQQAIYKTRTDLEDSLKQLIDDEESKRRSMLDGTVSMQEIILDVIKQRYQEEWDYITRDIDKKKSALEEERSLIDERLQMRKDSAEEAYKYEQLAEYQRQYALISMDSTRTKDAVELQKKIADLQKELAWDTAEDEAKAQQEAIDDQIKAYDEFQSVGSEDLELLLKDANNFTIEVSNVLEMSFNDMMNWLAASVEEYSDGLAEMQQQMLDSWEDTFRQLHGITGQGFEDIYGLERTYGEVPTILETKDTYLDRMKQSDQYINAISDEERMQLLYNWATMYDDYLAAQPHDADYEHEDDFTTTGTGGGSGSGGGDGSPEHRYGFTYNGKYYGASGFNSAEAAKKAGQLAMVNANVAYGNLLKGKYEDDNARAQEVTRMYNAASATFKYYSRGGVVDYTGLAWVDGNKSAPETFLSAADTQLLRAMLDAVGFVKSPYITQIDPSLFGQSGQTIGDISVVINEANISDDLDIEHVAQRVGEEIVKAVGKTGFNTGNYSF